MRLRIPGLCLMKDLTDVVDRLLDGPDSAKWTGSFNLSWGPTGPQVAWCFSGSGPGRALRSRTGCWSRGGRTPFSCRGVRRGPLRGRLGPLGDQHHADHFGRCCKIKKQCLIWVRSDQDRQGGKVLLHLLEGTFCLFGPYKRAGPPHQLEEGKRPLRQPRNETAEGCKGPRQPLYIFEACRRSHCLDRPDLVRIGLDPPVGDQETKASATVFLRSIVCRFGVPNRVITDNGTQFTSQYFQEYCEDMGIQLCFASVAHPRSNGQVERANAEILRGLKIRTYCDLEKHGARWIEELPSVLWANRTTPSRATGETPFFLVYGAEACLPPEITMGSLRVRSFNEEMQERERRQDVDLVDERRWRAAVRNARYNQALRRYHQRFVRSRELRVGDLVLRRILNREGMHKLSPSWEGPFKVTKVCRPGSVRLAAEDGMQLPNPWNIEHLRKFYP
jgi:hypothetical protein